MRKLGTFLMVALGTALAAGCSSSRLASGVNAPSTTGATTTTTTPTPTGASKPATPPRKAALELARRMVAEAVLPAGSHPSSAPLPPLLRAPFQTPAGGNIVGANRVFSVDAPPDVVVAFLKTHAPRGFDQNGVGTSSSPTERAQDVVQQLHTLPPNVSAGGLEIGVEAGPAGTSLVNVYGGVQWTAVRAAGEFVPAGDHAVIISVVQVFRPGTPVVRRVVVTDRAEVARIERRFDALRVAPPGSVFHCVALSENAVSYRIAFASSPASVPDLIATDAACSSIAVTAGRRAGASLTDFDGSFGRAVAHALGLALLNFQ